MKIYKNILKEDDKKKIFKFIKKEVEDLGGSYPCLQTPNNIHLKSEMKSFVESVQKYIKPYKIHKGRKKKGSLGGGMAQPVFLYSNYKSLLTVCVYTTIRS